MTYPNRAHRFGRLFVTTARQAAGAPVVDFGTTRALEGWVAPCIVIRPRRTMGRALVIGWVTPKHLRPPRLLRRVPLLGRLFRTRF